MPSFVNLASKKYGKLTVVERAKNNGKRTMWRCLCECGGEIITRGHSLQTGHTVSCGCVGQLRLSEHRYKHGRYKSRAYRIWAGMKNRCSNVNCVSYELYGGRGISFSSEWDDFENFYRDMGDPPKGLSLDRIDSNLGYTKTNCRWATSGEQARNKRSNIRILWNGDEKVLSDWAEYFGINVDTLYARVVRYNWTVERAFSTPVKKHATR